MDSDMKRSFVIEPYNMGKCSTEAIQKKRRLLSLYFHLWMQSLILEVSGKLLRKGILPHISKTTSVCYCYSPQRASLIMGKEGKKSFRSGFLLLSQCSKAARRDLCQIVSRLQPKMPPEAR